MGVPYYRKQKGLRFECTRCGNCCTRPGPVYFPASDLERAAHHLGLDGKEFRRRYRLRDRDGVPALDPGPDRPCTFHDEDAGCTIYEARPTQCRTWPFWPETVNRRRAWETAARDCEGMNQGERHGVTAIERLLLACEEVGLPEGDPWS
jgi:Fe-S-cluster containining protein